MIKVYISLFVGVACVSLASILIKLTNDVPSVVITAYRLMISSIILVSYSSVKHRKIVADNGKDMLAALLGGIFLSAHFIFWIASIKYTSIPSSVTLVSTSPVFVGIVSYFVFKEEQGSAVVISIVMSIVGSVVLASSDGGLFFGTIDNRALWGDIFAVLGAIAVSGYFLIGSYLRRSMDIIHYITLVYSFAAFFSLGFAVILNKHFFGYKTDSYIYMILLAVVPQLLGHTSFNWALKYAKTSAVAIATLGEPIGAAMLAYLFFHTTINFIQAIGMIIILASIFIASGKSRK